MSNTKPRRGLSPVSHARPLPLVKGAKEASDQTVPAPVAAAQAPQPSAPTTAPAPKPAAAATTRPASTQPNPGPGEGANRVVVRKRDNATLVRKNLRLKRPIAEALEAYCLDERWPESTIVERALEMYLDQQAPGIVESAASKG